MPFLLWPVITILSGAFAVKVVSDELEDTVKRTVPMATNNIAQMALVLFAIWFLFNLAQKGKLK